MRADSLRVAVRPRGTFECLDLAVMYCGRRPLAVALATAIGALPWAFLNRWLFAAATDDSLPFLALLLLFEAGWVAVPLTLYLGQSVFSTRFSWRAAIRALVGGLPGLILFQGLLRGLCTAFWFLAPFLLVWHYYIDQIILLERPAVSRVWRRRTAMNEGNVGRVTQLLVVDGLVMAFGIPLVSYAIASAAALWGGSVSDPGVDEGGRVGSVLWWPNQTAFFAVCGFLTVFRFFTYLDARIRREGWDVELKLRAEETWAGLDRRTAIAARGGAALMLVALASLAPPQARAAEAEEGDRARKALASQSFPWYDRTADDYRPIVRPPASASDRSSRRPDTATELDGEVFGTLGAAIVVGLLVVAVGGIVFLVVRHGLLDGGRPPRTLADPGVAPTVDDVAAALPAGLIPADGDLLGQAAALAERGDYSAAIQSLHAWILLELDRRRALSLGRGKTNRQYAAEVAASLPEVAELFRSSSRLFEDAFFGHLPVPRDRFAAVWERRDLVASSAVARVNP